MEGDPGPSPSGVAAVLRAVDSLRDDMREDFAAMRGEMRSEIVRVEDRLMSSMESFAKAAGAERDEDQAANEAEHSRFRAFIRDAELAKARRDGALGVFRFGVELISRHARPLVAVLGTLGVGAALLLGHVTIAIAAR